jgi:hypothetical protein
MATLDEEVQLRPEQATGIRNAFVDVMEELGDPAFSLVPQHVVDI